VDGKLTLLHFLEEVISANYPEVAGFETEINHVEAAARGMGRKHVLTLPRTHGYAVRVLSHLGTAIHT
jgi:hypothetical protein